MSLAPTIVLYRPEAQCPGRGPRTFSCNAEDAADAKRQFRVWHPHAAIVWTSRGASVMDAHAAYARSIARAAHA